MEDTAVSDRQVLRTRRTANPGNWVVCPSLFACPISSLPVCLLSRQQSTLLSMYTKRAFEISCLLLRLRRCRHVSAPKRASTATMFPLEEHESNSLHLRKRPRSQGHTRFLTRLFGVCQAARVRAARRLVPYLSDERELFSTSQESCSCCL